MLAPVAEMKEHEFERPTEGRSGRRGAPDAGHAPPMIRVHPSACCCGALRRNTVLRQMVQSVKFNTLLLPRVCSTGGNCAMRSDAGHLVSSQQRCVHQTVSASNVSSMNCSQHMGNSAHLTLMHPKGYKIQTELVDVTSAFSREGARRKFVSPRAHPAACHWTPAPIPKCLRPLQLLLLAQLYCP